MISPKTKLKFMGDKGWGLVAQEKIVAGAFVIEYIGEVVDLEGCEARAKAYEAEGLKHTYIMNLSASHVIDATQKGGQARFINHSCAANCTTQKWLVRGRLSVCIFAVRDIEQGEELTYNYNLEWNGGKRVPCSCGEPGCLGFLGAGSSAFKAAQLDAMSAKTRWTDGQGLEYEMDNLDDFSESSGDEAGEGGCSRQPPSQCRPGPVPSRKGSRQPFPAAGDEAHRRRQQGDGLPRGRQRAAARGDVGGGWAGRGRPRAGGRVGRGGPGQGRSHVPKGQRVRRPRGVAPLGPGSLAAVAHRGKASGMGLAEAVLDLFDSSDDEREARRRWEARCAAC